MGHPVEVNNITLQELVQVVLEEVDPVQVVEVPYAVRHPILSDDDGYSVPVLLLQPGGKCIKIGLPGKLILRYSINRL